MGGWSSRIALLVAALAPAALVLGSGTPLAEPRAATPDPAERDPLVSRDFQVQHQNPESLARIARNFGSGREGAFVDYDKRRRTVSARDHAAELKAIAGVIERLDVPAPPTPLIDLDVRVLLTTSGSGDALDQAMSRALAPLRTQLHAGGFAEIVAFQDRVADGEGLKREVKTKAGPVSGLKCKLKIEDVSLVRESGKAKARVGVDRFKLSTDAGALGETELVTALSASEGDLVTVGTVPVKGGSLVVLLRATEARP